ncbi:MAG: glycoside hydrolase family 2 [Bacteroidetes bacterium]|nr:MAG: glycoside hydrolase family 2 [Bacteroidota bacterium]
MKLFKFKISTRIFYMFLLSVVLIVTSCQNDVIFTKVRKKINFDADWKFMKGNIKGSEAIDFNDENWRSLDDPHDWSIEGEFEKDSPSGKGGGYLKGGIGWYRKTFNLPAEYLNKKSIIEFDGVYMNSDVWINGKYLGKSIYGYLSFHYDLTPYLNYGDKKNVLVVKVDNSEQPNSRWYTGSGIFRHVWLTVTDKIHVAHWGTFVTTPKVNNKSARVQIKTIVRNDSNVPKNILLTSNIIDPNNNVVVSVKSEQNISSNSSHEFVQEVDINNPSLWSIEQPQLYTVDSKISFENKILDDYDTPFGIRDFHFDPDSGFFLNKQNMKIKGVCIHHDLGSLGAALNNRALERRLEILKDMGCNAIRTSHNFPSPDLLNMCDKMGFLVLDEAFDMWYVGHTGFSYDYYFERYAILDLKRMIHRDRNHPSVFMWSVGNEISAETMYEDGSQTLRKLVNAVHEEDTTRPVTNAVVQIKAANATGFADILDAVGYNYFGQGMEFDAEKYDKDHIEFPNRIIFGSENASTISSRGVYHFPADSLIYNTEDMQCSSFDNCYPPWGSSAEENWKAVKERDFVSGLFVWTGFDYIGEPTPYLWPARSSYFGLIDLCGFPKDGFYFYKSQWTDKPMVHILPHWNWEEKEGELIDVWAYTNCDEVELFLNDKSLGIRDMNSSTSLKAKWKVSYAPGTLKVVGKKDGMIVCEEKKKTAGTPAQIKLTVDRKNLTSNGKDICFIKVIIEDKEGIMVPNAENLVKFKIEGEGELIAVGNGNPLSHESFQIHQRKAFNGLCQVLIQSTLTSGNITIIAESDGLTSDKVMINTN